MRYSYLNLLFAMLKTDFFLLKKTLINKWIDLTIWVITTTWVFAYIMPRFGLKATFGTFIVGSICASAAGFEVFPSGFRLVHDLDGNRVINFYLTLPAPGWLILLRMMINNTLGCIVMSLPVIPLCKLLFWHTVDLSQFNIIKFCIIFILINIFYGSFALWLVSLIPSIEKYDSAWTRIVFPLWYLGGFQFSWHALYETFPAFAYINLINPYVYLMEGIREAVIGNQQFFPFAYTCIIIIFFTIGCFVYAYKKLQKTLDFI